MNEKQTQQSNKTVALNFKAYSIAADVDAKRKSLGMSSSVAAVISEAIVKTFGEVADEVEA